MNQGRTVFSQVMDFLPMYEFHKCVKRYSGNRRVRTFSCLDQFLAMAFAQVTYRESLRDIEACLSSMSRKLLMPMKNAIGRSMPTLPWFSFILPGDCIRTISLAWNPYGGNAGT